MSAQSLLTIAGTYVGAQFGYPQLGAALGSLAGAYIDAAQLSDQEFGRLGDMTLPRVDYGQPMPFIWGRFRTPGVVLWQSALRELASSSGDGKGGGPEVITYTYECDVLYEVNHRPSDAVSRIWRNKQLVWVQLVGASAESLGASLATTAFEAIEVHTGDVAQSPDAVYEAALGIGNVPAYRGRTTVMLQGVQLGASKQLPLFEFEVLTDATSAQQLVETAPGTAQGLEVVTSLNHLYSDADITFSISGADGNVFDIDSAGQPTDMAPNGELRASAAIAGTGKRYFEFYVDHTGHSSATPTWIDVRVGGAACGANAGGYFTAGGGTSVDSPAEGFGSLAFGTGTPVVMVAIDFDADLYWMGLNGTWVTNTGGTLYTGNPGTGVGGRPTGFGAGDARIYYTIGGSSIPRQNGELRTVSDQFSYAPPTGFVAWAAEAELATIWTPQTVYLDDVVTDLCERAGVATALIDATDLAAIEVTGVPVTAQAAVRGVLEALAASYYFECFEADKLTFVLRGGASAATITADDTCAGQGAAGDEAPLSLDRGNDQEVPSRWNVNYYNLDDDYQAGSVHSDRQIGVSEEVRAISVPLVLTAARAKGLAETIALDARVAATALKLNIDDARPELTPTDVMTLVDEDGISYRARIVREQFDGGVHALEAILDDASVLLSTGATQTYTPSIVVLPVEVSKLLVADMPLLRDEDDGPGLYLAVKGGTGAWNGATVHISRDATNYTQVGSFSSRAIGGEATIALGNWTGGNVFDEVNTVTVDVGSSGTLSSYTREAILTGAADGYKIGSELLYARTATLVSAGVYTLSGLLRGQRGTEWAMDSHAVGEAVLLLRARGILRVPLQQSDLNQPVYIKVVTTGRTLAGTSAVAGVPAFVSQKPYAPTSARVERDTSNNATITWNRRSRLSSRFLAAGGVVPLGEAGEQYQVDILDGSTVVRTITASSETASYTAAQQTADGLTPGDPIAFRVYQLSASVGRGYPLEATA